MLAHRNHASRWKPKINLVNSVHHPCREQAGEPSGLAAVRLARAAALKIIATLPRETKASRAAKPRRAAPHSRAAHCRAAPHTTAPRPVARGQYAAPQEEAAKKRRTATLKGGRRPGARVHAPLTLPPASCRQRPRPGCRRAARSNRPATAAVRSRQRPPGHP
jgi:hypothetical protein